MTVRRTLPVIALSSALSLALMAAWPVATAAQDRGAQRGSQRADYSSALKFDVNPNRAEVFVDGSYAGRVDDFDGVFQRLRVRPGQHEVVVYLDGYRTMRERFHVAPGDTRTIRLEMKRLARGEQTADRPNDRGAGDWWDARWNNTSARFGTLSLGIAPGDAEVWIDGRRSDTRGHYERMAVRLEPGRHSLEVRRSGYETYTRQVNVPVGSTVSLNVSLRRSE